MLNRIPWTSVTSWAAVVCGLAAGLAPDVTWGTAIYTAIDLGTLGGTSSAAYGINANGQVVGWSTTADGTDYGFVYSDGAIVSKNVMEIRDINDMGQMAANSWSQWNSFAYRCSLDGGVTYLGTFDGNGWGGSYANAINASGHVVGRSDGAGNGLDETHAFRITAPDGVINPAADDLGTLGGTMSEASDINDSGQVVGYSLTIGDATTHAFRTFPFLPIDPDTDDLGTLGGTRSCAVGINANGRVVGWSSVVGDAASHAFRTKSNCPINLLTDDLGTLGGTDSLAYDINARGQVVGTSYITGSAAKHAFVYPGTAPQCSTTAMADLNSLVQLPTGTTITQATAINDFGQIAATASLGGTAHALRLIPVNKYKQRQYGTAEPAPWATELLNPEYAGSSTFGQSGCTISCLATAVSLLGINKDPLDMRDWISAHSLWDGYSDNVSVGGFWVERHDGTRISTLRSAGSTGYGYEDIVSELRHGRPVLLAVPSRSGVNPNTKRHYIVAFGLDWSAFSAEDVMPSQILISDPSARKAIGYAFDDTSIAPTRHLTLADYFDALATNCPRRAGTDCQRWFDFGHYSDNGVNSWVSGHVRPLLLTKFVIDSGAKGSIAVQSPVEVIITDPVSGQRYASSSDVAQGGDILLARTALDIPDDDTPEAAPDSAMDSFPPYSLWLPDELCGKSLDVSIIGIGTGPYSIDYHSGTDLVRASDALTGFINEGEIVIGRFDVEQTETCSVSIETVRVSDPGNAGEWSGQSYGGHGPDNICGAVSSAYNIGKYEVTAGQYCEFLNKVAATDTYGLYNTSMAHATAGSGISRSGSSGSYTYIVDAACADRPVNYVSWGDAARFANWLHNGQRRGDQDLSTTEDGSYHLNGATTDAALLAIMRKPGATWTIPTEDEWYKAAYYKGGSTNAGYFDYPTSSDVAPGRDMADTSKNNANFYAPSGPSPIDSPYYATVAGEFQNSDSPYGTFDQGGNLWEWNEAVFSGSYRGLRGGASLVDESYLLASGRYYNYPTTEHLLVGFRVTKLPQPVDFDADGDVDSADFDLFKTCVSGPAIPYAQGCSRRDLDADGDVDQVDFGLLQRALGLTASQPPGGVMSVTDSDGLTSEGPFGGPFKPANKIYIITNTGSEPMSWTATSRRTWITLSNTSGLIASGESVAVTVAINAAANALPEGVHSDTISFANTANSNRDTTRTVDLKVNRPPRGVMSVTESDGLISDGPPGGPFTPMSKTYTLRNTGGLPFTWTASCTEAWLTVLPADGVLSANAAITVTVSVNSVANTLGLGTYSDVVTLTNTTDGVGNTTRPVTVTVTESQANAQDFDSMPAWSSSFTDDFGYGTIPLWSIVPSGESGSALQAEMPDMGWSSKVLVFSILPSTNYTISIYMRCTRSPNDYWMACSYRLGNQSAMDAQVHDYAWKVIQEFSNWDTSGGVWTQYSTTFNSGSYSQVSVCFHIANCVEGIATPGVAWDTLRLSTTP